jgi:hypothetical protein
VYYIEAILKNISLGYGRVMLHVVGVVRLHLSSKQSEGYINATQYEFVGCSKGRNNLSAACVITLYQDKRIIVKRDNHQQSAGNI